MLTVYKEDLKEELALRQGELTIILAERDTLMAQGDYNPFRNKEARDIRENMIECFKEINKLKRKIRNKNY